MNQQEARRVVRILRQGTVSPESVAAVSVGTESMVSHLNRVLDSFQKHGSSGELVLIEGEWGSGKSHSGALCRSVLGSRPLAWVHSSIDGKGTSLSHLNRCVSVWLSQVRIGPAGGLKPAIENGILDSATLSEWIDANHCDLAIGLSAALAGFESGWLRALGNLFSVPDSSRQRQKSIALLKSTALLLREVWGGRLVILLDEVENISREWDVRGRRRAYDTLAALLECPDIQLVLFVTPRLSEVSQLDLERSRKEVAWSDRAVRLLRLLSTARRLAVPRLDRRQAVELIELVAKVAGIATGTAESLRADTVRQLFGAWQSTATSSTRLLVRMTIHECDLAFHVPNDAS